MADDKDGSGLLQIGVVGAVVVLVAFNWERITSWFSGGAGGGGGGGGGPACDPTPTAKILLGADGGKGERFPYGDNDMYLESANYCVKLTNNYSVPIRYDWLGIAAGELLGTRTLAPGEWAIECGVKRVANARCVTTAANGSPKTNGNSSSPLPPRPNYRMVTGPAQTATAPSNLAGYYLDPLTKRRIDIPAR